MCDSESCCPPSQTGTRNWGSLPSQFWGWARLNTTSCTRSLLTQYQRAKNLEGLFQYNYRAPQGSLCQKSDSHVVCGLQKYIPKYTPFQKPTQSKASVPPTNLLSQLFLLNTCLRNTERTHKSAVRKQRGVFLSRNVKIMPKCTNVKSNSLHRIEEAAAIVCETAQTPFSSQPEFSHPLYQWAHRKKPLAIHLGRKCQLQYRATEGLFREESLLKCIIPLPQTLNFIISIINTRTRERNSWVHTGILQLKKQLCK